MCRTRPSETGLPADTPLVLDERKAIEEVLRASKRTELLYGIKVLFRMGYAALKREYKRTSALSRERLCLVDLPRLPLLRSAAKLQ